MGSATIAAISRTLIAGLKERGGKSTFALETSGKRAVRDNAAAGESVKGVECGRYNCMVLGLGCVGRLW